MSFGGDFGGGGGSGFGGGGGFGGGQQQQQGGGSFGGGGQQQGGGYDSSASAFGGGGGFQSSQQGGGFGDSSPAAGGGEQRKPGRNGTLTPVTVMQLQEATQANPEDNTFTVDGVELVHVAIVGAISNVEVKSTNTVYTIDDGTGVIEVMLWTTGEESEQSIKKKELWSVGVYVKCLGSVRNFQGKKNIGANLITLVKDPNQIMFHYLQAISVHKANSTAGGHDGMKVPMNSGVVNSNYNSASPVKPANMNAAPMAMEGMDNLTAVQQAVCTIIGQNKADTGCSITDIEQGLTGQFSANMIREAAEWLSSEGHVYPTIDDNHFQLCQA